MCVRFEKLPAEDDSLQEVGRTNTTKAQLAASALRLNQRLELPWQRIARLFYAEPFLAISIQIANHMHLFKTLHEQEGSRTVDDLAHSLGRDPSFIRRILRSLSAGKILEQHGSDAYFSTPLSEVLLVPEAVHAIDFLFESGYPYFALIPEYIQSIGFVSPADQGAWQNFRKTDMSIYEWLDTHPEEMMNFVGLMKVWSESQEPWIELYPADSLLDSADKQGTILVDVAGGGGRDINNFLGRYPQTAGRLVLQDRPEEVKAAKIQQGIERMPHDIFTPQPIKAARAYFLHSILHNYTDERARDLLGHLKKSMNPGYSKVLVYEDTVSNQDPKELSCGSDLVMMATFGTGARTELDWELLFDSVGLKLNKTFRSTRGSQCLMELELVT
ncbi:S-adenosyl-L-methionine-dependent methyltransferase [Viridothelium virens]|uniref:S-adenosyl-L-methionine-dependent methyltransferase n=1 Tax=Viridothelium virens TaxID=1048519 RepID=A0A6A6GVU2_VIRVR|nr:S-adenosyl-L-methionine-dependent methyltransferase [Viridothelium virens]